MIESIADYGSTFFQVGAAVAVLFSIRKLHLTKQPHGVHWFTILFFFSMGVWKVFLFWHFKLSIAWIAAAGVAITNFCYLVQIFYYQRRGRWQRSIGSTSSADTGLIT